MMANVTSAITPASPSPVYMTLDLFELLDACETLSDKLIEGSNQAHQQTLYRRLANCLEAMQAELEKPLPPYLIQRLTAEKLVYIQPQHLTGDSESAAPVLLRINTGINQPKTSDRNK